MEDAQSESLVYEYIVTLHLFKALERDRRALSAFKLAKGFEAFFDGLCRIAERRHVAVKRGLRRQGCRIVLEELLAGKTVHVMYVRRGYEYHCRMMPMVLKARCEEALRDLLKSFEANATLAQERSIT